MKYKHTTFLMILILGITIAHAQKVEKFNPEKDKREVNGYTIHLMPMPANTFGFFIMKGNKPVYSQLSYPFSHNTLSLKTREDAYKLAEWVIGEDSRNGKPPAAIPATVIKQLNLQGTGKQQ